ncbi:Aerobic glycerol-3-phosphate dehydrogenase [Luteitalea pratensis]|uniref:Glycerol-3-phosphate dehydrogenase n=1 Tax=Luteitalea pratensis TaxID=1855912 RepID=A0A143PGK2_LUTPR|nr:glycerol-3-phosphate dehydrogenase/oxidase [Luteitalea pratensis]AMY06889.1 Aerobic glycerol-3-phosphate dehydrogenase [Luteitalea pratensis]
MRASRAFAPALVARGLPDPPTIHMRAADLHRQSFDVLVVGGGIIGCGVARDAASRGLRVAIFEQDDFGSGTSAGSTRLIHGGLRYLEMLDLPLVRLDLRERETLLRIARHLVKPLRFLLPFYDASSFARLKMRAGMWLYDALSYDRTLDGHRMLSADAVRAAEPRLVRAGLQGAASYSDAQAAMPERLCIENIVDAADAGAAVCNYSRVVAAVVTDGRMRGVRVQDAIAQREVEVSGRVVVNASGPWFDRTAGVLQQSPRPRVRTTRGIHIACDNPPANALALPSAVDGRLMFVIPWLGHAWVGTTDIDYNDDPGDVAATPAEVEYLRRSVEPLVGSLGDVFFTNAGVRALVRRNGDASAVTRSHRVIAEQNPVGLVSIIGGKLTGYRAIAEEATQRVCRLLDVPARCTTATTSLPGARPEGRLPAELNESQRAHLATLYGSRRTEVLHLVEERPELAQLLMDDEPDVAAQVVHAVRHEACERVADFVFRRSQLAFTPHRGRPALARIAAVMREELGWSDQRVAEELTRCRSLLLRTDGDHPVTLDSFANLD